MSDMGVDGRCCHFPRIGVLMACCGIIGLAGIFNNAQAQDTLQAYPSMRPLIVQYKLLASYDYHSKLFKDDFEKGEVTNQSQFSAFLTFPLYKKNNWILTGSANYLHLKYDLASRELLNANYQSLFDRQTKSINDAVLSLNVIRIQKIGENKLIFNASLIMDSRDFVNVKRFRGLVSASLPLINHQGHRLMTGIVFIVDRSSRIPVFPIVSYSRIFNPYWELDITLPSMIYLRRRVLRNAWLSAGGQLGGNSFFSNYNNALLPGNKFETRDADLFYGLTFEYPVNRWIMFGVNGQFRTLIDSWTVERGKRKEDYFLETSAGPSPEINFSISLTPQTGLKKHKK